MFHLATFIQRNSRRLFASCAIVISIIAALSLAGISQSSTPVWIASHPLAPGSVLSRSDITHAHASLGPLAKNYYTGDAKIIGNVVTRQIGGGELIPLNAIAQVGTVSDFRQLPIGIARSDLPGDLTAGDRVDLYAIPRDPGKLPELVANNIRIQGVDLKSRDLGGAITVLFLVHEREVMAIVDSLTSGRIVVVRNAL